MSESPSSHAGAASRAFYEEVADRTLDQKTARGIDYRNQTVAGRLGGFRRVLEIGPGEGFLVGRLLGRGHQVVAADLSRRWLERLPSAGHPSLLRVQGDAGTLPFPDEAFDAVVAAEVLEHLPDPAATIREAARILRPGGRFVATVPYRETLRRISCPHCGEPFEPNGHLRSFTEDSLAAMLDAGGLRPGHLFVGPTRLTREIWRRLPWSPLLPALATVDRLTLSSQRVSDTWMLREGTKV